MMAEKHAVQLSKEYLQQVRKDGDWREPREKIKELSVEELAEDLDTAEARKAFWINFYNAAANSLLEEKRSRYRFKLLFYYRRYSRVAGKKLSLNKIEHGLLRNSRLSFGFGYLRNPFAFGFEKKFRVGKLDSRIHFALNCGAKSCPPIGFYTTDNVDEELDIATESYLSQETDYLEEENTVEVPRIFLWFRGDFGGKEGIYDFLRKYGVIPENVEPKLEYQEYDWSLEISNFR